MSVTTLPGFLTVPQVAADAQVSEWMVRKEIKEGHLRARRLGRCVRITPADKARWMSGTDAGASA
jgi:excisionase family DNA binding protein